MTIKSQLAAPDPIREPSGEDSASKHTFVEFVGRIQNFAKLEFRGARAGRSMRSEPQRVAGVYFPQWFDFRQR